VFSAPLGAALATMVLPAAKRTPEIPATPVAGMRKETNPTLAAEYRAVPQRRTLSQDGVQGELILTNERLGAIVLVPILAKSKNFRDGYRKSDRLSVKMLIVLCMSSSYSLDASASRGRARIFCAFTSKPKPRTGLIAGSDTNCQPRLGSLPPDDVPA
jgi:hypothetical protein